LEEKQRILTPPIPLGHLSDGDTKERLSVDAGGQQAAEGKGLEGSAVGVGLSTILEVSESEHKSEPSAVHQQLQERVDDLEERLAIVSD
jgi:hypothetical protein